MVTVVESKTMAMMWSSMFEWLTPTSLFLLLNVVIGSILLSSKPHSQPHHDPRHLPRTLSRGASLLGRLRSINLSHYRYRSDDIPLETAVVYPPVTAVMREEEEVVVEKREETVETLEDAYKNFKRCQSDPTTATVAVGRVDESGLRKMASERAPEKAEKKVEVEKEVDARADDFINRFRKQLQLQRLESLLRNRKEQGKVFA